MNDTSLTADFKVRVGPAAGRLVTLYHLVYHHTLCGTRWVVRSEIHSENWVTS